MSSFTIPDPEHRLDQISPAAWMRRRAAMRSIAANAQWWVGDYLNAAPTEQLRTEWINSDARFCSTTLVDWAFVARQFRADESPSRLLLPWSKHHAAYLIADDEARHETMNQALARGTSLQDLRSAVNQHNARKPQ